MDLEQALADIALQQVPKAAAQRLAALLMAKSAMPNADVTDRMHLAHYILTGSGEFPTVEEQQRIEVRNMAGDLLVSYPEPQPEPEHPDDPGPQPPHEYEEGGILGRLAEEVPPAPSSGTNWRGRPG